uniref:Uncharacterized protein n=1 Tax=Arundo donax TaxID=35708 RepID=A0A0A8YTS8_ARUDO
MRRCTACRLLVRGTVERPLDRAARSHRCTRAPARGTAAAPVFSAAPSLSRRRRAPSSRRGVKRVR